MANYAYRNSAEYIKRIYAITFTVGQRVTYKGIPGKITGAAEGSILIRLDGETRRRPGKYHPTDDDLVLLEWRPVPEWAVLSCPDCGDDLDMLCDHRLPEGRVGDGDKVQCSGCKYVGAVSADAETGEVWLQD